MIRKAKYKVVYDGSEVTTVSPTNSIDLLLRWGRDKPSLSVTIVIKQQTAEGLKKEKKKVIFSELTITEVTEV